ncbi:MAG: hypothetical protein ACOY9J_06935 [Pseudomonadota bacterium]
MTDDYSKAALARFLDIVTQQGLVNTNTGMGWKAACNRIFEDVPDEEDVRTIDVDTAIKRYNNRHPGTMKPSSLKEYERRLKTAIRAFTSWVHDPSGYKPHGKSSAKGTNGKSCESTEKGTPKKKGGTPDAIDTTGSTPATAPLRQEAVPARPHVIHGLSLEFPMRPDFLAQVVVPRDMRADEAKRLSRFIMTLAQDYEPPEG